jgi:hypothetical protein
MFAEVAFVTCLTVDIYFMPSFFQLGMNGSSPADGWPPYPVDSPNLFSRTCKKRKKVLLVQKNIKKY